MPKMAAVATLLALPAVAAAHDFWVERVTDGFVARYGHRGGEVLAIDAAKVKAIRCIDASGDQRDFLRRAEFAPKEIRIGASCAAISVLHDGGYWSVTPDGEVNLPKNEARNAVKAWASRQYAKWVDATSPLAATVLGDELELVPVTDLAKARQGDKLTLRVLSRGEPVPNAVVAIGHRSIGETDSRGEIRLRIRSSGVESIATSVRRSNPTPEADTDVIEASLTFEVAR